MEDLNKSPIALSRWDKAFNPPARYAIAAATYHQDRVSFTTLRKALGISATLMSKHVSYLEKVGYLTVFKVQVGRKVLTELSLTEAGRTAFDGQEQILKALATDGLPDIRNASEPTNGESTVTQEH